MSAIPLERRVEALEMELARLREKVEGQPQPQKDWLDKVAGSFANDPLYDEAMRLGREWRESFRPKPRKKRSKRRR